MRPRRDESGQATAELALVTPFVLLLFLCLVQVGLVARDQILVTHAARAGARAAAVDPRPDIAAGAASSASDLERDRMSVDMTVVGRVVRVTVRYRAPPSVPFIGTLVGDVALRSNSPFRLER